MDAEREQPVAPGVVVLKGSWTIERAQELKQILVEALETFAAICVDVSGLTEADLSSLQTLCAAHRTSLRLEKPFGLAREQSPAFGQAVHDAGFVRTLGCHHDPEKDCLWVGGRQS